MLCFFQKFSDSLISTFIVWDGTKFFIHDAYSKIWYLYDLGGLRDAAVLFSVLSIQITRQYWFRSNSKLQVIDILHALGYAEYNLNIFRKCFSVWVRQTFCGKVLVELHVLKWLEHDLLIFRKCLSTCLSNFLVFLWQKSCSTHSSKTWIPWHYMSNCSLASFGVNQI